MTPQYSYFIVCSFMENSIRLKRFFYLVGPEVIMDMTDLEDLDVVPRSSDKQAEDLRSVDTEQSGININFVVVCFSRLLKCLRSLYGKQCGPRTDCSYRSSLLWVSLFGSILNSSVMLGKCLQQTTSTDDIFRCIFFLSALRVNFVGLIFMPLKGANHHFSRRQNLKHLS